MAKKSKGLTPGGRARRLVTIRRHDLAEAVTYTLPVNPDFADESINYAGGVDYPKAPEVAEAERAIVAVFNGEIGPLRAWVDWAAKVVGGGLPGLAARLLGMPLNAETRKDKTFKAELRKLEEYRQGKYKSASGVRQERLLALNSKLLRQDTLHLKVLGDWEIESGKGGLPQVRPHHWGIEEDTDEAKYVLDRGGGGFCAVVEYAYARLTKSTVKLLHVYALQIERLKE